MASTTTRGTRCWLQFRLRTLLALTTLCSLALAFWGVYIQPYRHEARLIARLQDHGAMVATETEGPAWLRSIAGDRFFRRIVQVDLGDPKTTDDDLRRLAAAPRLRALVIAGNCKITDAGLRHVAEMKHLDDLTVLGPATTDEGLKHLAKLAQVRFLDLMGPFTDLGLKNLSELRELRFLVLASPHLSDQGLSSLRSLSKLQGLILSAPVTDGGMKHLLPLNNLETLVIKDNSAKQNLLAILSGRTDLEFLETPLRDVAAFLSDFHQVPIRLDTEQLQTAGHDPQTPITVQITDAPLQDALRQMLDPLRLDYLIGDDELLITTADAAAARRPGIVALKKSLPKLKQVSVPW